MTGPQAAKRRATKGKTGMGSHHARRGQQGVRRGGGHVRPRPDDRGRKFVVFVGPSGLRQVHAPAADRRAGGRVGWPYPHRTARTRPACAGPARLAMVFQSFALYPHMSVRKGTSPFRCDAAWTRPSRIAAVSARPRCLNLTDYPRPAPGQLSGAAAPGASPSGGAIVRETGRVPLRRAFCRTSNAALAVGMRLNLGAANAA